MTFTFRPPAGGEAPIFVMISGGTNTGKTWSSLRLLRGMVGRHGRIAAIDTEGGRLTNLRRYHDFEINIMHAPFTPTRFAEGAEAAERLGFHGLLIDTSSMMHVGPGGYRDWHHREIVRLSGGDEGKFETVRWRARSAPSLDRQAMLYRMLQLKIPVVFSCRARQLTEERDGAVVPIGWQPVIHPEFIFDMTLGLTLLPGEDKGIIRHQAPFKIERNLAAIFPAGETLTERHGEAMIDTMRGSFKPPRFHIMLPDLTWIGYETIGAWASWWDGAIASETPAGLDDMRRAHAALLAIYAEEFPAEIELVQRKLDQAVRRHHEPAEGQGGVA